MTKLYLIRHAEAEGNLYRRVQGWYDSLITDNGYRQIAALEARFESIQVDAAYASDLFRTRTTARAICASRGLVLHERRELRELHMGIWEDRTWGDAARENPEQLRLFNATDPTFCAEGCETFQQVRARMAAALREIAAAHDGETVAVFSHGLAIRNALAELQGVSVADSAQMAHSDNTGVSLLEFDGDEVRVVFHNDASHLPDEISTFARQKWWKQDTGSLADENLWFRSLNMQDEAAFYKLCRAEGYEQVCGSLRGYDEAACYREAAQQQERGGGNAVFCAMLGDEPVGILQLDLDKDERQGAGDIALLYLLPEQRKKGLGVQLIGQAVATYRPMQRRCLTLRCAADNAAAQRFYSRFGFVKTGEIQGARAPLTLLEKRIDGKIE